MYVKHLDFWKINSINHAFLIQFKDSKYLLFYNSIQASPSPIPRTNVSKQIHTKYMRPNKESPNRIKELDTYQQKKLRPSFPGVFPFKYFYTLKNHTFESLWTIAHRARVDPSRRSEFVTLVKVQFFLLKWLYYCPDVRHNTQLYYTVPSSSS